MKYALVNRYGYSVYDDDNDIAVSKRKCRDGVILQNGLVVFGQSYEGASDVIVYRLNVENWVRKISTENERCRAFWDDVSLYDSLNDNDVLFLCSNDDFIYQSFLLI